MNVFVILLELWEAEYWGLQTLQVHNDRQEGHFKNVKRQKHGTQYMEESTNEIIGMNSIKPEYDTG